MKIFIFNKVLINNLDIFFYQINILLTTNITFDEISPNFSFFGCSQVTLFSILI